MKLQLPSPDDSHRPDLKQFGCCSLSFDCKPEQWLSQYGLMYMLLQEAQEFLEEIEL